MSQTGAGSGLRTPPPVARRLTDALRKRLRYDAPPISNAFAERDAPSITFSSGR